MYINGTKVAFGLVNDPSSSSDTIDVPAGPITIEAVPANKPESDYLYAQNGVLVAGDLLNVFVVGDSTTTPSTVAFLTNANRLVAGTGSTLLMEACSTSAMRIITGPWAANI